MNRRGNNNYYNCNDLCSGFNNLSLKHGSNNGYSSGIKGRDHRPFINPNHHIIDNLGKKPVWYVNLHPLDSEYKKIENMITNHTLKIEKIVEVNNDVLKECYEKKKIEKIIRFRGKVEEKWLFHGTSKANVDDICTYNFDWRLFGDSHGHKYGKGVNFSTNAMYASYYSDKSSYHKVMIVAKVLVANACQGNPDMTYPPDGYDTSQKDNGIVTVKYDDNEFYPAYKLYYHIEEDDDDSSDNDYDNSDNDDDSSDNDYDNSDDDDDSSDNDYDNSDDDDDTSDNDYDNSDDDDASLDNDYDYSDDDDDYSYDNNDNDDDYDDDDDDNYFDDADYSDDCYDDDYSDDDEIQ